MKRRKQVKCKRCDGKGMVSLDPILAGTLHILREFRAATAHDFYRELKGANVSITAYNKRLERLRSHGLVTREKHNGGWLYRPKTK